MRTEGVCYCSLTVNAALKSDARATLCVSVSVMSNNSTASSSLVVAQKAVKQLRLEASVHRIKVNTQTDTNKQTNKQTKALHYTTHTVDFTH